MRLLPILERLLPVIMLAGMANAAFVIDPDTIVPVEPTDNCWNILEFDLRWFEANVCTRPLPNQCLFYDSGLSDHARTYARAHGLISIWDVWGEVYYSLSNVQLNTMRCIMADEPARLLYFEWMSRAMASLCTGNVLYMTPHPENPGEDGYFGRFEKSTMLREGAVTKIDAINLDGTVTLPYWSAPSSKRRVARSAMYSRPHIDYDMTELDFNMTEIDELTKLHLGLDKDKRAPVPPERDPPTSRCNEIIGAEDDVPARVDACGDYPIVW